MTFFEFFTAQFARLAHDHPVIYFMLLVPIATAIINPAVAFFTSANWFQITLAHPRLAGVLKILKSFGIDPAGVLKGFHLALTGRPWQAPPKSEPERIACAVVAAQSERPPPMPKDPPDEPPTAPKTDEHGRDTLSSKPSVPPLALLGIALFLTGCGSLRPAGSPYTAALTSATPPSASRCETLDDRSTLFGGVGAAAAIGAGGSGFSTIGAEDKGMRTGLAITSVSLAMISAGATLVSQSSAKSFVAEGCGK